MGRNTSGRSGINSTAATDVSLDHGGTAAVEGKRRARRFLSNGLYLRLPPRSVVVEAFLFFPGRQFLGAQCMYG